MRKFFNTKKWSFKILLLLTVQVLVFVSCSRSDMENNVTTTSASSDTAQQTNKYSDGSFHYQYGNSSETHGEFWIWTENGSTYFEGSATGLDISTDAFAEVDSGVFEAVIQVIQDNQIGLWDGFSKKDDRVQDGYGFSLDMECGTESIHAYGYMFEPENYQAGHAALVDFLSEYAESLPVTIPSVDAVGYIFAYTEEFRFDVMLAMYDGIYSRVESVRVAKKSDEDNFYTFYSLSEIPSDERQRYVELDFEPARQLRERVIQFELSNGLPRGDDSAPYVAVNYWRNKITASHYCHAVLPLDEQHWLIEKILTVIGLPADFDLNTLF